MKHLFVCIKTFSIGTPEQTDEFKAELKVFRIERLRDIQLLDEPIKIRVRHRWKHGNCEFNVVASKLTSKKDFFYPTCGNILALI